MKKALFITAVTIIVTVISLTALGILSLCFMGSGRFHCGTPQHAPQWAVVVMIAGMACSFPVGWFGVWLGGVNSQLWFILVGLLVNGLLWGQFLWHLGVWIRRINKAARDTGSQNMAF